MPMDTNGSSPPTPRRRRAARPAPEQDAGPLAELHRAQADDPALDLHTDQPAGHDEPEAPVEPEVVAHDDPGAAAAPRGESAGESSGHAPSADGESSDEDDDDGAGAHQIRDGVSLPEATLASLHLERGAIGRLDAQKVDVHIGAIGAARAEEVEVELGAIGAAMANELEVSQAMVGTLVASEARLEQAVVRSMIARSVVVEKSSLIGFLVARRVSGDVRVLFDWRGALVFGGVVGLLMWLGRGRRS